MLVTRSLSEINHIFPSQYASPKRGEDVAAIWKKMIFDGEGFDANKTGVLKDSLKAYLLTKVQCGGNFVKFCDQFWAEILEPQLKEAQEKNELIKVTDRTIQNVFAMFQVLAKGYIEGDTFGVRESPFSFNPTHALKEQLIPLALFTVPIALSRYRTARQCSVGMSRLANRLKTFSSDDGASITVIYNTFKNQLTPAVAQNRKIREVVRRDPLKNISEIREMQTYRLASTIVRIATVAASVFLYIKCLSALAGLFPGLALLIWVEALPVFALILLVFSFLNPQGALKDGWFSLCSVLTKVTIASLIILIELLLREMTSAVLIGTFLPGLITIVGLIDVLGLIWGIMFLMYLNTIIVGEREPQFYQNTLENDSLRPIVRFLSNRISEVMDAVLFLVDGKEQTVVQS